MAAPSYIISTTLPTEFITLGPRISLHAPSKPSTGELIILCTWLGAVPKHFTKYATLYQKVAPGARVLLIQSNVPILISSYKHQRDAIQPAVAAVLDVLSSAKEEKLSPKVILHTFSNGGGNTAIQLLIVVNERLGTSIPLSGIVLDSNPAKGSEHNHNSE